MDLIVVLIIFAAGLLIARQTVVRVAFGLALALGVLIASNAAGDFVHTLLDGAYRFVTGA